MEARLSEAAGALKAKDELKEERWVSCERSNEAGKTNQCLRTVVCLCERSNEAGS